MEKLALWDELALSRILLRVYGVWVYPGANHIGEYLAWSDQFLASAQMQYFYDPMTEKPWSDISNEPLEFIYSIGGRSWEKVVEVPAMVDGNGIHPRQTEKIPAGLAAMMAAQGSIADLLYEAYIEKDRKKLLQAVLLDPTVSSYSNAVNMINEMCELQKDILPDMNW